MVLHQRSVFSVHERRKRFQRIQRNLETGMLPTLQIVLKIIPDPVEPWRKILQDNCGVIILQTICDSNTWTVMVTVRHTTVYGMLMGAVNIVISGSQWTKRPTNIRNGSTVMTITHGNQTMTLDKQIVREWWNDSIGHVQKTVRTALREFQKKNAGSWRMDSSLGEENTASLIATLINSRNTIGMPWADMLFLVTSVLSKQNGTYRACKMTLWLCCITVVTSTTRKDTTFALQIHGVNTKNHPPSGSSLSKALWASFQNAE